MDQVRIGSFIAQLRREKGWTQEELGEQVGVTNKTVSRWENGNYMPSIEILTILGEKFGVSLNELLEGRRLETEAEFRAAADGQLASALQSPRERLRRWLERYGAFPAVTVLLCAIIALCFWWQHSYAEAHPEDVRLPGTFACKDIIREGQYAWMYFTFDRDGRYYVFDSYGNPFETGVYTLDGDVAALDDGEETRWIVIKGKHIHDEAPWGGEVLTYEYVSSVPTFINHAEERFAQ